MRSLHPRGMSLTVALVSVACVMPAAQADSIVGASPQSTVVTRGGSVLPPSSLPSEASTVGSAPVGSTRYTVPADAIYVAPAGSAVGAGTVSQPYVGLATAIARAATGSTLVLRAGTYHESVTIPFAKKLVIQSYPGEAVWLDGSSVVTGWVASGTTWYKPGWNYAFDHTVSFNANMDESNRYVDPAYPMAGYPDQLFVDGVPLRQVGSLAAVKAGTFFVDTVAKRLVMGSDPAGHEVRASTLTKGMTIHGAGSTVRGIGVRRYANHLRLFGAISAEVPTITLENLVITHNATVGLYASGCGPPVPEPHRVRQRAHGDRDEQGRRAASCRTRGSPETTRSDSVRNRPQVGSRWPSPVTSDSWATPSTQTPPLDCGSTCRSRTQWSRTTSSPTTARTGSSSNSVTPDGSSATSSSGTQEQAS